MKNIHILISTAICCFLVNEWYWTQEEVFNFWRFFGGFLGASFPFILYYFNMKRQKKELNVFLIYLSQNLLAIITWLGTLNPV
jgi:hypothetical protein